MNDQDNNLPKSARFSAVVYLINLLSVLYISKEIRKRWTGNYQTPAALIKDIQEYIGRRIKRSNEK